MPYSPTTWADSPATTSPLSAANLNKIETELARLKVNADLDPAAAIAYSKLVLALSIVNGDVSASAAIAYSKLNLATSIVNGDISASAAIASSKLADPVARGLYRKTTTKAVNTSTTATDLLNGEITIAAGAMGATGLVRLTAWGDWLQNSGGAAAPPRWQLLFGGATLLDSGATGSAGASATRAQWCLQAEILNSASGAQVCRIRFEAGSTGGFAAAASLGFTTGTGSTEVSRAGAAISSGSGVGTGAVDTTLAKALVLNVINGSVSATYETKLFGALVEIV